MANILVVDDDEAWFAKCLDAVSELGVEVRQATGGPDAISEIPARVGERSPDLVFVGVEPSQQRGQILWLLEGLVPDVPVVICSAEGDLDGGRSFGFEAAAFLHKFAEPAEIVAMTARVLGEAHGLLDFGRAFGSTVH